MPNRKEVNDAIRQVKRELLAVKNNFESGLHNEAYAAAERAQFAAFDLKRLFKVGGRDA